MDGVVGEIPWTAMKLYADEYEFDTEQRDFLYVLCSEMDTTFCKIVNKKE